MPEHGRIGPPVKLQITVALLLTVASAFVITLHWWTGDGKVPKELEFAIAVIGGAAAVYDGYYAAATLRSTAEQTRIKNSFDFLIELNEQGYFRNRVRIAAELTDDLPANKVHAKVISNPRLLNAVRTILASFEDLSVAIQAKHVDEKILFYSVRHTVCW